MYMRSIQLLALVAMIIFNSCSQNMSQGHKHTNKLINESSPYLLQHAHNPVNWNPWGDEALAQAEKDIVAMERQGIVGLNIAVNLSFKQLQDVAFCENLPKRIRNWFSSRSQLEFELTETAVLNNPELVKKTLKEISDLGVKISLDDFGTGYSALAHVQDF